MNTQYVMNNFSLEGRKAIVTGAAQGMGRSIAVIRAWVEDAAGAVCAEGVYTFRLKPME